MKRMVYLTIFILFLSACSQGAVEQIDPPSNELEEEESLVDANQEEEIELVEEEVEEKIIKAQYEMTENWFIKPISKDVNEKAVLLTIDDAPDTYALTMAKTLQELNASAIFFVNGHFLETDDSKTILKEIYDKGFLIGNHTYSHSDLQSLSEEEQKEEIIRVSDMVEEIIGERPQFFRAPFGNNTDFTKQIVEEENMVLMNWVYGYDWNKEYMTKESITDIMINTDLLSNGANLLMHDREWTSEALHDIVVGLRDKGYEIIDPALIKTIDNE